MNIAYKLTSPSLENAIKLESQGNVGYQKALLVKPKEIMPGGRYKKTKKYLKKSN
jgi:hypothetical protein